MVAIPVECYYYRDCSGKSSTNCKKCKHNSVRNKEINYFEEAHDNPRPEVNPKVSFSGPAEQTAGYKCPMCGEYTNPYHIKDSRCSNCGFKLNCG